MPKATDTRPSRRLDAILVALKKHGVRLFKAADLPGVGSGIEFEFEAAPVEGGTMSQAPAAQPRIRRGPEPSEPLDELALAEQGRTGLDDRERVS